MIRNWQKDANMGPFYWGFSSYWNRFTLLEVPMDKMYLRKKPHLYQSFRNGRWIFYYYKRSISKKKYRKLCKGL